MCVIGRCCSANDSTKIAILFVPLDYPMHRFRAIDQDKGSWQQASGR